MDDEDHVMVRAERLLVGRDLGEVRQGDHLLVVGKLVFAVDTSRPVSRQAVAPRLIAAAPVPSLPEKKQPEKRGPYRMRDVGQVLITEKMVLGTIQQARQPMSSLKIADALDIPRPDGSGRSKVARILNKLIAQARIVREVDGFKQYRYRLPQPETAQHNTGNSSHAPSAASA